MKLSNKLTNQEMLIRELQELKKRIDTKTKNLYNLPKVPLDRVAKGINLSTRVEEAIRHAKKWEKADLNDCLGELEGKEKGVSPFYKNPSSAKLKYPVSGRMVVDQDIRTGQVVQSVFEDDFLICDRKS